MVRVESADRGATSCTSPARRPTRVAQLVVRPRQRTPVARRRKAATPAKPPLPALRAAERASARPAAARGRRTRPQLGWSVATRPGTDRTPAAPCTSSVTTRAPHWHATGGLPALGPALALCAPPLLADVLAPAPPSLPARRLPASDEATALLVAAVALCRPARPVAPVATSSQATSHAQSAPAPSTPTPRANRIALAHGSHELPRGRARAVPAAPGPLLVYEPLSSTGWARAPSGPRPADHGAGGPFAASSVGPTTVRAQAGRSWCRSWARSPRASRRGGPSHRQRSIGPTATVA